MDLFSSGQGQVWCALERLSASQGVFHVVSFVTHNNDKFYKLNYV